MVIHFQNPHGVYPDDSYDENDDRDFIDEEIEQSEQAKKRRRHVLRLLLRAVIAKAIAAGVIELITWLAAQRVYSSASYEVITAVTSADETRYVSLGNHIVYYSNDGASCMNRNGSNIWSISFEMQNPVVAKAGNVLAIGDYNGSTIYLVNDESSIGTVDTSLPIRDLSVSENGEVAAVLADTDTTWVYLYASDGSTIAYFKTTMSQSGYPVSVAVSPDGELVCVSHLLTDSTGVHSSIAFYNFGAVGQNVAENNVAGFNYEDEIFPYTRYMTDSSCVAVSDARIAWFNGKEIPQNGQNAMFSEELQGIYDGEKYIGLLFPDTSGAGLYSLHIYDTVGNEISEVSFDQSFTNIQIAGNCIYINDDSSMSIYTVQGQLRYSGTFPMKVISVIPEENTNSRLFLATENGIEEMTLQ